MIKSLILGFSDAMEQCYKKGEIIGGRHRIDSLLGTGSYGRSYLVYDCDEQRQAVLKSLRLHKRLTRRGRESFMREAELLQSFCHPAIPKFYCIGEHQGVPYFTMEQIHGKTFEQLIFEDGKTYSEHQAFTIGMKIIRIIGYIHSSGIVHRDIRIPNVMVQGSELKLIDFGLARSLERNPNPRRRKPANLLKEASYQSDFYGLGHLILFLLYSGFEAGENQKELCWEEELKLPSFSTFVIRKLLQEEKPYQGWKDIYEDFYKIVHKTGRGGNENVNF